MYLNEVSLSRALEVSRVWACYAAARSLHRYDPLEKL